MHHHHNRHQAQSQRGNGLIEVLVLIFIVSVGLLGMSKLQSVLVREGSQTNSRSVAVSLVLAKIDDLKSFNRVEGTADTPCNAAGIFCYTEIGDNAGGDMVSGQRTIGNTAYNLTWDNTDWFLCNNVWGNAAPDPDDVGPGCNAIPLHKTVAVNVSWVVGRGEVGGVVQDINDNLRIERSIFANSIFINAGLAGFDGSTLPGPKVAYTPIQAPDAISIEIGGGKSTETAKPLPEVSKKGDSLVVTLPSVVYESNGNTGQQFVSQEEFSTVNCSCKFDASGTSTGYTPFRPIWDPTITVEYSYKSWQEGETVAAGARRINTVSTKTYIYEAVDTNLADTTISWVTGATAPTHTSGQFTDGGANWRFVSEYVPSTKGSLVMENGSLVTKPVGYPSDITKVADRYDPSKTEQSPLCTACCRDHHDVNNEPSYRPYIASFSGDHAHYTSSGAVATITDTYVESCRMQRVDGYWRVTPDWLLIDLTAMNCDYFAPGSEGCPPSGTPDATLLTEYRDRVRGVLADFVDYIGTNKNVTTKTAALGAFNTTQAPLIGTADADAIEVTQGGTKQLIARGIYADVIFEPRTPFDPTKTTDPRRVDETYYDAIKGVASNWELLGNVRFYDNNLTLLGRWSPTSTTDSGNNPAGSCSTNTAGPDPVCVTNQPIKTVTSGAAGYYDDFYNRGKIVGRLSTGTNLITVSVNTGNTGFTNSAPIDASTTSLSSQVKAKITGSGGLYGQIVRANEVVDLTKITITSSTSGLTCAPDSPATLTASSNVLYFTCTVPPGTWAGTTLTFTSSQSGVTYADGTEPNTLSGSTLTVSALGDAGQIIAYGSKVRIKGTISEVDKGQADKVTFGGSGLTCSKPTKTTYSCEANSGWSGTVTATSSQSGAVVTPSSKTYTAITVDQVNQNYSTYKN